MTKLTKTTLFKAARPRAETAMDKTARAAREILDDETERRKIKTERLRKTRLEREARTPAIEPKAKPTAAAKKPRAKAVK